VSARLGELSGLSDWCVGGVTERCDACGKFRAAGDLAEDCHQSIGEYGDYREQWRLYCRVCEPRMFEPFHVLRIV